MKKLTHQEIVTRQRVRSREERLPFSVVLNDIRSLYNVGSIFRTADGAGIEKIWVCGITGRPPNTQISKTALGAEESVPWEYREDIIPLLRELKAQGYRIILLEQTAESVAYQDFSPEGKTCLVVGNEIKGVTEEVLRLYDEAVEIEMDGVKNSLNVSVAFGIIAYHFRNALRQEKTWK